MATPQITCFEPQQVDTLVATSLKVDNTSITLPMIDQGVTTLVILHMRARVSIITYMYW